MGPWLVRTSTVIKPTEFLDVSKFPYDNKLYFLFFLFFILITYNNNIIYTTGTTYSTNIDYSAYIT